jgi:uncharacterized protein
MKLLKKSAKIALLLFLIINVLAAFQAYNFTHYTLDQTKLPKLGQMSIAEKCKALLFGVSLPKIPNKHQDFPEYELIRLGKEREISCWYRQHPNAIGTCLLAHGHGGNKSMMDPRAKYLYSSGYNIILPDFPGHGDSKGQTTTVGYKEAEIIPVCYQFWKGKNIKEPFLGLGTSMGAASLMRANAELGVPFDKLILECPYATLQQAVKNRFTIMKVPSVGLDYLLILYGSAWMRFNAFQLSPEQYAKQISCPVLLIRGAKDTRVLAKEAASIYKNCSSNDKKIVTLPNSDHADFLTADSTLWKNEITKFVQP